MTRILDHTHDPAAQSWVDSARRPGADFPIQNLPLGVFRRRARPDGARLCVAIGDEVVDLNRAAGQGLLASFQPELQAAIAARTLNPLMALGRGAATELRHRVFALLRDGASDRQATSECLVPVETVELLVPADIGDYTDFYASIFHATNVGSMFRPENPLLPNYKYVPIGYHGRASSIVPSGTAVRRPMGQIKEGQAPDPVFGPSRSLDYECEIAAYLCGANPLGTEVPMAQAESRLFGICLLNDWSARDIQSWEYQPLGPFLAKNFATSVSPWVVTMDALAPFRVPFTRREGPAALERYCTGLLTEHPNKNCDTLAGLVPGTSEQRLQGLLTAMTWDEDDLNRQSTILQCRVGDRDRRERRTWDESFADDRQARAAAEA